MTPALRNSHAILAGFSLSLKILTVSLSLGETGNENPRKTRTPTFSSRHLFQPPTNDRQQMSIAINTDRVTEVLLTDGWHIVDKNSFDLDSYEYLWGERLLLGGGHEPLIPATGFTFLDETGSRISGPLTAVLAVREMQMVATE